MLHTHHCWMIAVCYYIHLEVHSIHIVYKLVCTVCYWNLKTKWYTQDTCPMAEEHPPDRRLSPPAHAPPSSKVGLREDVTCHRSWWVIHYTPLHMINYGHDEHDKFRYLCTWCVLDVHCIALLCNLWLCNPSGCAECGMCIDRIVLTGDRDHLSW